MYIFEAHYIKMNTDEEVTRTIEFEEQSFGSEKECYLYAMGMAFDMKEENECLSEVEFIAC